MPDTNTSDDTVDNKKSDVNDTSSNKSDSKDDQVTNLNAALRSERGVIKSLQKEIDALKNSQLEEQGKFKELYETQKTEFESLKSQVGEYETFFSTSLETAKEKLAPEVLELLPTNLSKREQLSWIDKASVLNTQKPKQKLDATRGMVNPAGDDNKVTITQEEYTSMSPEDRLKHLDEAVKLRGFGGIRPN